MSEVCVRRCAVTEVGGKEANTSVFAGKEANTSVFVALAWSVGGVQLPK